MLYVRNISSYRITWGGGDSLVEHAATMIHALMNEKSRKRVGITDDLIILSIGLEDVNDLIGDLDRGLD